MYTRGFVYCVALALAGCGSSSGFVCRDDAECRDGVHGGRCEPVGYCSFPDDSCPETERRFGELAPSTFAGKCVTPDADDVGVGSSSGSTSLPPTDETSTTTRGESSSGGNSDPETTLGSTFASDPDTGVPDLGVPGESESTTEPKSLGCAGERTFFDDFEDDVLAPEWDVATSEGCTVVEQNGALAIAVAGVGDLADAGVGLWSVPMIGATATIDVRAFPDFTTLNSLSLRLVADAETSCYLILASRAGEDSTVAVWSSGGDFVSSEWLDLTKPFTLQIRLDEAGTISYEVGVEGAQPVPIHSEPNPCPTDLFHVIVAGEGSHTEPAPVVREVESFELCVPG